ncbi:MAG: PadR family transcriptional regulator [Cyanobacteria bacterium P01_D01_bin.128]
MSTSAKGVLTPDGGKDRANYLLSALEEDILTVLLGRPLYGLLISRAIAEASNGIRQIGVGSLYPTLRRLEKKGFVSSYWEGDEDREQGEKRGGARRRYYKISPTGSKVLLENRTVRENLLDWQPV